MARKKRNQDEEMNQDESTEQGQYLDLPPDEQVIQDSSNPESENKEVQSTPPVSEEGDKLNILNHKKFSKFKH